MFVLYQCYYVSNFKFKNASPMDTSLLLVAGAYLRTVPLPMSTPLSNQ
jgi:hypothetical protein